MEILAGLIGAFIGGAFAIFGAWKTIHWQTQREARGAASAIAAELAVAQRVIVEERGGELYQQLLDEMKATGRVVDRQLLIDLLDNQPQDVLPVYYSMAGKLGLLPPDLASDVVEYHSLIIALPRTVVRFLGKRELNEQTVRSLATSVERLWHKANDMRPDLISRLEAFSTAGLTVNKRKGLTRLGIALAVPYFGFWALMAWLSDKAIPRYVDLSREAVAEGDWKGASLWMKASNEANAWVVKSLTWGLAAPIIALIVLAICYWVYRGFKPQGH